MSELIKGMSKWVQEYMIDYDASHDYNHILRVVDLSRYIAIQEFSEHDRSPRCDLSIVHLSALLHEIGDHKYASEGRENLVECTLMRFGADSALASTVQTIVRHVSYSTETRDPNAVQEQIRLTPELAAVQDADRLEAMGAIGIGRAFTYGGAKKSETMEATMNHFEEKLERLEGMMKTRIGKMMAAKRNKRLKMFRQWWEEESAILG